MNTTKGLEKTSELWSSYTANRLAGQRGLFWWDAGPAIHHYINRGITGNPKTSWLEYSLKRYFDGRLPLPACLSLGCGDGHVERTLSKLNAFETCQAYDIAEGSIKIARELAADQGRTNIEYAVADIEKLNLPVNCYDAVWIHSAMHHFSGLERICKQIRLSLKQGGLLLINEYVGPDRFQFPERQKEIINLCLALLPTAYRTRVPEAVNTEANRSLRRRGLRWFSSRFMDKLRDGDVFGVVRRRVRLWQAKASRSSLEKRTVVFPSLRDVIAADPTEAIRSSEIVRVVSQHFEILEKKDWGGNILQFLLADIAGNFSDSDRSSQALLEMLTCIENTLIQCHEFESDFSYIVGRPR